jgi:hypothetical protein
MLIRYNSDLNHEPPPSSLYPSKNGSEWDILKEKAERTLKDRSIEIRNLWYDQDTHVEQLQMIFPDAIPILLQKEGLKEYFTHLKDRLLLDILAVQVKNEIIKDVPIPVFPTDKTFLKVYCKKHETRKIAVQLQSPYPHLDCEIQVRSIQILDDNLSKNISLIPDTTWIRLPNNQKEAVTCEIQELEINPFWSLKKQTVYPVKFLIQCNIKYLPIAGIQRLNIEPEVKNRTIAIPVELSVISGTAKTILFITGFSIVIGILIIFFVIYRILKSMQPATLYGQLVIVQKPEEDLAMPEFQLDGLKKITIGTDTKNCTWALPDGDLDPIHYEIYAVNKRDVKVRAIKSYIDITDRFARNKRTVGQTPETIRRGERIGAGKYLFEWK